MTIGALFGDIGMFVDEGTLVFHVAAGAEGFGCYALEVLAIGRKVRVVAIGADHLVFGNRMMGELGELHFGLYMTAGAELFLLVATDFLLRPFMKFVTVEAADVIKCMCAGIPAGQVLCRRCRVALQAEH